MPTSRTRRRLAILATGGTLAGLAVGTLTGSPTLAATATTHAPPPSSATTGEHGDVRSPGFYDARQVPQSDDATSQAERAYVRSLGAQALVDVDPLTGTPRQLGRLDGFLTASSSKPARTVALDYVRSHLSVLGLSSSDLSTLNFARDYVDSFGVHNLSWTQSVDGTPVFGNGLKVKVTRDGRVLDVQGSPVHDLQKLAAAAPKSTKLDAAQARTTAARDVGSQPQRSAVTSSRSGATASTKWANHDYSTKVWFLTSKGLRPGWSTYVTSGAGSYQHVVDGVTGGVLLRRSTTDNDSAAAVSSVDTAATMPSLGLAAVPGKQTGKHHGKHHGKKHKPVNHEGDAKVFPYYPGATVGGKQVKVNFFDKGWLGRKAKFLNGANVIAWADVNDDNAINQGETTPVPGTKKYAQFTFKAQKTSASKLCSPKFQCSWDPSKPNSWKVNEKADVTNAFYLANRYHDWLENGPAKFTVKAGNFTSSGGDPVLLNALDGADTNGGLPDGNHIDNANMSTPPDGTPPTMQMYLWHQPGATDAEDPFVPTSGAFDPSVLFHEYTHGLSNRLVVDADGVSTLNDLQAGSMGEAWSDYYAMDYLVRGGYVKDTPAAGEVFEGDYLVAHKAPFRTMAIDCPVHSKAKGCSTSLDGVPGGYTYSDVATIGGGPEVHASGEVWAQTLWDIRKEFGSTKADELITRAMSLSADDPSMLDMRNAIIQADLVGFNAADTHKLWKIFANRGMGFYAGTIDSADAAPADDFHVPPSPATKRVSISGTVTDATTGDPVSGAIVLVTGQTDDLTYAARTDDDGHYTISGLYRGTYAKVVALGQGYFPDAHAVSTNTTNQGDFSILRDFASSDGGAEVTDYNGPNYAPACGPDGAIDLSQTTGWGSTTGDDNGTPTNTFVPKHITVHLPEPVDITTFGVDPNATCGDGGSASTGGYTIETSTDGTTWTQAASGTFTAADRGKINRITPTTAADGVTDIRFTITSNQTPDFATNCPNGAYSGCSFTDLSELAVFGAETGAPATP